MTKTEKAKLQKRARDAVTRHLALEAKFKYEVSWGESEIFGYSNNRDCANEDSEMDAAIRRELRRAIRLVRSNAK